MILLNKEAVMDMALDGGYGAFFDSLLTGATLYLRDAYGNVLGNASVGFRKKGKYRVEQRGNIEIHIEVTGDIASANLVTFDQKFDIPLRVNGKPAEAAFDFTFSYSTFVEAGRFVVITTSFQIG